ncbi:MAG: hypothetical protein L3J89_14655 [Gammaproteobacteria bacterium]|nr:hypothetical protein [Gammaproteobacteria bacterium]
MEKKINKPKTLEEIKQEKGKTCWAYLIAEEKNDNKKIQQQKKTHR